MKTSFAKTSLLLLLLLHSVFLSQIIAQETNYNNTQPPAIESNSVELTVLMYPWVPDYEHIANTVEAGFEAEYPDVDLLIAAQNFDYYEPGGLETSYDVYELDTVFLADFAQSRRIQPLNPEKLERQVQSFPFAQDASEFFGRPYGAPHWVCALYLFYHEGDEALAQAENLDQLVAAIGADPEFGKELLIDMKGDFTLTEFYMDASLDSGATRESLINELRESEPQAAPMSALAKLLSLTRPGVARSPMHHEAWPPFTTHEFAHGRGRALAGYSERMFHIIAEATTPTDPTPTIDTTKIRAKLLNLAADSPQSASFAWVDSFAISRDAKGEKLEAAYAFINYMARDEVTKATLFPPDGPPLYLLPAYPSVYQDPAVIQAAPLYTDFLRGLYQAIALKGVGIPNMVFNIGPEIDKTLPNRLYPGPIELE